MQIIKSLFIGILLFVPFLKAYASNLKDSVSFGFNTYSDNSNLQVYSPTFSLMKTVSKHFLVGLKMRVDAISSASIRNGGTPTRKDTVAGASKNAIFDESRFAPTFLVAYDDGENSLSTGAYFSAEEDYTGKAIFINYVRQLNEANTALGVGFSQSADKWNPVFKRNLPDDSRNERKIDLSINQLITPNFSMQLVYSYMYSQGFLSSTYNYLGQDSFARFENYPNKRTGHAFAIKGVSMLGDNDSMNYSYRYYKDDWEISSHTLGTEWLHQFNEQWTSGTRLRYYKQSKSYFAKNIGTYKVTDQYFASDYRMSAFNSYDIGIPLVYKPSGSDFKISFSVDYYSTSNNDYIKAWHGNNAIKAFYTSLRMDYDF